MVYYLNGEYYKKAPNISVCDRGFTLGDGCFTTLRVKDGAPLYLKDHIDRLNHHLKSLFMRHILDYQEFQHITKTLCDMSDYTHGVMRITLSRGNAIKRSLAISHDMKPTILISLSAQSPNSQADPINACISPIKRNHTSPLSRVKSLSSYLDNIIALEYAKTYHCDDVLFFNLRDEACCFTIGNILIETHDNHWLSPPSSSGCLEGITLKYLPQKIEYMPISHDTLKSAKNIYRTNSVSGVVKVILQY